MRSDTVSFKQSPLIPAQLRVGCAREFKAGAEQAIHQGQHLAESICVVVRIALQLGCVPALLIRDAQLDAKGVLLGLHGAGIPRGMVRGAGHQDLVGRGVAMDGKRVVDLALELAVSLGRVRVLSRVDAEGIEELLRLGP
jgi:hypothetical protein